MILQDTGGITPFHTFDPMESQFAPQFIDVLHQLRVGGVDSFSEFTNEFPDVNNKLENQGVTLSNGRNQIELDDATLLFIALKATNEDGGPAEPLDRGISMERLGRFPTQDGNAVGYLRENLIPENEDDDGSQLLKQLDAGLRIETRGHDHLSIGFGGMTLHGWLTIEDVVKLRTYLQKSPWKVNQNEPFDGGVRDVVRHLLIILKTAEKRNCGILMRSHD
ncbi:MAG: hypothetical protein VX473_00095 [Candidatus Thermoplasmatota archaeon]|nr:hypothetical protein [Candidatus Thermoplasmatota archaeon]